MKEQKLVQVFVHSKLQHFNMQGTVAPWSPIRIFQGGSYRPAAMLGITFWEVDFQTHVTSFSSYQACEQLLWNKIQFQAKAAYDGSSNCKILEPSDIANAVIYATTQPDYVGVNEILIEPREAPA